MSFDTVAFANQMRLHGVHAVEHNLVKYYKIFDKMDEEDEHTIPNVFGFESKSLDREKCYTQLMSVMMIVELMNHMLVKKADKVYEIANSVFVHEIIAILILKDIDSHLAINTVRDLENTPTGRKMPVQSTLVDDHVVQNQLFFPWEENLRFSAIEDCDLENSDESIFDNSFCNFRGEFHKPQIACYSPMKPIMPNCNLFIKW